MTRRSRPRKAGAAASAIALVLGTLASLAVARHRFFGRETISFLVILPIALPGIVTGIALNSTFTQILGIDLSLFTIVVGHATFCIVVIYNNAVARLRRLSTSFEEASADLYARPVATFAAGALAKEWAGHEIRVNCVDPATANGGGAGGMTGAAAVSALAETALAVLASGRTGAVLGVRAAG